MASFSDLPLHFVEIILSLVLLSADVRTRNSVALVCKKWFDQERESRTSFTLRGRFIDSNNLPKSFPSVTTLDMSLLYPYGYHAFTYTKSPHYLLIPQRLAKAFPAVTNLTIYVRNAKFLKALVGVWPQLKSVKMVCYQERPFAMEVAEDLMPLFTSCASLTSLDLSEFYGHNDDILETFKIFPATMKSLQYLNLLSTQNDGYLAEEFIEIVSACPNLTHLLIPCVFSPDMFGSVGDAELEVLAAKCPHLVQLHLVDPEAMDPIRREPKDDIVDSNITGDGLGKLFTGLPQLEDFALDICNYVLGGCEALEKLSVKCPKIRILKLGFFLEVCVGDKEELDGVALCRELESLSIKNCNDLTDEKLECIARGCTKLSKFEIHGCPDVTEDGMRKFVSRLRSSLVDVRISYCLLLDAKSCLAALEPIRHSIESMHIDYIRPTREPNFSEMLQISQKQGIMNKRKRTNIFDLQKRKKAKNCDVIDDIFNEGKMKTGECSNTIRDVPRAWDRLRYLSLWVPVESEPLSQLPFAMHSCPNVEEVSIKVEDAHRVYKTSDHSCLTSFGFNCFGLFSLNFCPRLVKLKLDCSQIKGYSQTALQGCLDLSILERYYLNGIYLLENLNEFEYWPPQSVDITKRSVNIAGVTAIQQCKKLRKLFIHGSVNEHFMSGFTEMSSLRDVLLLLDYVPAPDNDTSTEMRGNSCCRFYDKILSKKFPD